MQFYWNKLICRHLFSECDVGTYGQNCSYNCSINCVNGQCERTNGHCSQGCLPGYYYPQCNEGMFSLYEIIR